MNPAESVSSAHVPPPRHLLIAEDDDGLSELFRLELEGIGLPIHRTATGTETVAWLRQHPASLLLLDYSLPDMTGRSLVEAMAREGPVPPFIVVTGHGDERVAVSMMKLGARDYLVKDTLLLERLSAVVRRVLDELASHHRILESERRFRALFENSNDAIMILAEEGFLDCNQRTLALLGLESKDAFLGRSPGDFSPACQPDGRESHLAAAEYVKTALDHGRCRFDWLHLRQDGTEVACEVQLSAMDLDGRRLIQGTVRDITARKQAEEALRRSEAKFFRIFHASPDPISLTCATTGRYLDVNDELVRRLGYARDEIIGRTAGDLNVWVDPEDRVRWMDELKRTGRVRNLETRYRMRSGEVRDFRVASEAVEIDGVPCFLNFSEDITDRHRAETALRESEARYRHLLGSVTDYIYVVELENGLPKATTHSPGCINVTGYTPDDYAAQPFLWLDMIPPADRPVVERQAKSVLQGEIVRPVEHRIKHKDGSLRWVRNTLVPRHDAHGRLVACDGLISDITERMTAEQATEEAADQLRETQRITRLGSYVLDLESDRWTSSPTLDEILGINSSEFDYSLQGWIALLHPSDRAEMRRYFEQEVVVRTTRFDREYRIVRPSDGAERWVHGIGELQKDGSGRVVRMVGSIQDVTERRRAQELLQESEARYRFLAETITDVVWILDLGSWKLTYVSPSIQRLSGFTAEESMRMPPGDLLMPASWEQINAETPARIQAFLAGDPSAVTRTHQVEHRTKSGPPVWVEIVSTVYGDKENGLQVIGVSRDIGDRRKAELALQRSETELLAIYDHAPVVMCLLDATARIRRVNRAALDFDGGDAGQLTGKGGGSLIGCITALENPEACGASRDCCHCALRCAILDALNHNKSVHQVEVARTIERHGVRSEVVLLASTAPIELDGAPHVLLALEDVTARRQAERQAIEQAALLDIAQDAIFVRDFDDRIHYWNQGAVRLYGWSVAEALSRPCSELIFSLDKGATATAEASVREHGTWVGEMNHQTRTRGRISVQSRWTLVRDASGQPASALIVNTDLSETKRLTAQLMRAQRLESIGTLASGIAHDLNNVLSPIVMSLSMLRELSWDSSASPLLDTMEDCVHRGADIVRQVLTFARGATGDRVEIQPKHVVQEIARIARETFPRSIEISVDFCRDPWRFIGDPTQIQQVLMNLCVNARDAMPNGGTLDLRTENRTLETDDLKLHPAAKTGRYCMLTVADTGSGIPPEILEKIFDPFFTTKPAGQGTGLGLAMSSGIVERHGGFFVVNSDPGFGTTFQVFFPAIESTLPEGPTTTKEDSAPTGRGELILVVDDEMAVREVIASMLRGAGYRSVLAREGGEALAIYRKQRDEIGAVLTDLMMPGIDGPTLVHQLRSGYPNVRIAAMTGLGDDETADAIQAEGVEIVLEKPFSADELLEVLHRMLHAPNTGTGAT